MGGAIIPSRRRHSGNEDALIYGAQVESCRNWNLKARLSTTLVRLISLSFFFQKAFILDSVLGCRRNPARVYLIRPTRDLHQRERFYTSYIRIIFITFRFGENIIIPMNIRTTRIANNNNIMNSRIRVYAYNNIIISLFRELLIYDNFIQRFVVKRLTPF